MKKVSIAFIFVVLFFTNIITCLAVNLDHDYKKTYRIAEEYFINENYTAALPFYLRLDSLKKDNANINFKIGYCYLNSSDFKTLSIPYFEKASSAVSENYVEYSMKEKRAPQSTYSYLAKAYQLDYKFDEAIATYKIYRAIIGTNPNLALEVADIDHDIETCKNAKELVANPTRFIITNLGKGINGPYADYSPVVSLDEKVLIFTSRRPGTGGKKEANGQYFEDIYVSEFDENSNVWGNAKSIGTNVNSPENEATINLSADGQNLLIYKDINGGDIYLSQQWKTLWGEPKTIDEKINSPYWETHACFNSDNSILYFVSDRPGGFGGRDIYKCMRLPNGLWSAPQNLGSNINTIYDEDGVFIHPNGKEIFWSSKGHNTMGGFDIFSSKIDDENGFWTPPINMGYPINSPDDDVFFVVSADGKRAYFSSVKPEGFGEKDIYKIEFRDNKPEALTLLKGVVSLNEDAPEGSMGLVEIIVTDIASGTIVQTIKPIVTSGKYLVLLPSGRKGKTYNINCTSEGCKEPINLLLSVTPDSSFQEIVRDFKLQIENYNNKEDSVKNEIPKDIVKETQVKTMGNIVISKIDSIPLEEAPKIGNIISREQLRDTATVFSVGDKIDLGQFLFDWNNPIYIKAFQEDLDELYVLMRDHPDLIIEVSGHTDSSGTAAYNMKLSKMRSQLIVEKLVSKGIPRSHLIPKGFGATVPVAPNTLPNGKPNVIGMKKNRRVELRIVNKKSSIKKK